MLHRGGEPNGFAISLLDALPILCGRCCMVPCCLLHGTTLHVACCMLQSGVGSLLVFKLSLCGLCGRCCTIGVGSLVHRKFPNFGLVSMCELFVRGTMVPCCTEVGSPMALLFPYSTLFLSCVDGVAWYHVACCMVPRCMLHVACC